MGLGMPDLLLMPEEGWNWSLDEVDSACLGVEGGAEANLSGLAGVRAGLSRAAEGLFPNLS